MDTNSDLKNLMRRMWDRTIITAAEKQHLLEILERARTALFTPPHPGKKDMEVVALLKLLEVEKGKTAAAQARLQATRETLVRLPALRLEVARMLTVEGEARVLRALEEHIPAGVSVEFVVRPQLTAGAVIMKSGKRFDASWARKITEIPLHEL